MSLIALPRVTLEGDAMYLRAFEQQNESNQSPADANKSNEMLRMLIAAHTNTTSDN